MANSEAAGPVSSVSTPTVNVFPPPLEVAAVVELDVPELLLHAAAVSSTTPISPAAMNLFFRCGMVSLSPG